MKKLVIDIYGTINVESTALILSHPTNVFYTAQCDGIGCSYPEFEGVVFDFGDRLEYFDDCKYGCHLISYKESHEIRTKLANDLDAYFIKECEGLIYKIRFDYDRIDKLMEGWWPIIFTGSYYDNDLGTRKGIIHTGNCD